MNMIKDHQQSEQEKLSIASLAETQNSSVIGKFHILNHKQQLTPTEIDLARVVF
jgi:hypothetical protein